MTRQMSLQTAYLLKKSLTEKPHTFEGGGTHTPHDFCLVFIDELEKQLFTKKLLKWVNKKCANSNI